MFVDISISYIYSRHAGNFAVGTFSSYAGRYVIGGNDIEEWDICYRERSDGLDE